jgi:hypothetical protein
MPARFEGTIVYAGELEPNGRPVQVLGYENTAQSLVGGRYRRPWRHEATGNAMLLHFPAVPGSMTQANVVDTERTPEILPRRVIGKHYAGERMRNTDFVGDLAAVHQRWTSVERDILEAA